MQSRRTLVKRRRADRFHLEAEKYNWQRKGWTLVKEEPDKRDDRGYTFLYFERPQILTLKGWVDVPPKEKDDKENE